MFQPFCSCKGIGVTTVYDDGLSDAFFEVLAVDDNRGCRDGVFGKDPGNRSRNLLLHKSQIQLVGLFNARMDACCNESFGGRDTTGYMSGHDLFLFG